jgi:hypothetical protein
MEKIKLKTFFIVHPSQKTQNSQPTLKEATQIAETLIFLNYLSKYQSK